MNSQQTPLNPAEVEQQIRNLSNRIARGVEVYSKRLAEFYEADRDFDRAYSAAYLDAEGSIKDREHHATLATIELREARDVAEVAYKYADRLAKALENQLRAMQSIGASVRAMYGVAGRGEGA